MPSNAILWLLPGPNSAISKMHCFHLRKNKEQKQELLKKRERQSLYNLSDHYDLLHGLDLGDKFNLLLRHKRELTGSDATYLNSLKKQFDKAIPIRADIMHGRPLTVDDYIMGYAFGADLAKRSDYWAELSASLSALQNNPEYVLSRAIVDIEQDGSTGCLA